MILHLIFPQISTSPQEISKLEEIFNRKPDIVFFGDSTIRFTREDDKDLRPTTEIFAAIINKKQVAPLNHDAFEPHVYKEMTKLIAKKNATKYLIIPINLRSFGYKWETTISYQFQELRMYLKTYGTPLYPYIPFLENVYFFDLYKHPYSDAIYEDYINTEINTQKNINNDQAKLRESLLLDYMYTLDKNSRHLKSLAQITALTSKTKIIPIFYITPIDYQTGNKYYPNFSNNISKNIELIKEETTKNKSCFIDLSQSLETSNFAWQSSGKVNEHLNQDGRHFVATQLKILIESIEKEEAPLNCNLKN